VKILKTYCDMCDEDITSSCKELNLPFVVLSNKVHLSYGKEIHKTEYEVIGNKNYELCEFCYDETLKAIHDLLPVEPD
jgi:hypothetical protein